MNTENKKQILIEIANGVGIKPYASSNYYVEGKTKFSETLLIGIRRFELNENANITEWIVTTRRSPQTFEFPIAANDAQIKAWQREQSLPKKVILGKELEWSYDEIIKKYHTAVFHVEKKN
jgi:hypothetical protein